MGRRGPQPLPTEIKLLHGETRSSRLNRSAPRPKPNRPVMPTDMGKTACVVWKRVMRHYAATGVLTAVDTDVFRAYCEAVGRYMYAAKLLEGSGPLVRGARQGELVKNPLHQIVRDNADLLRQFARELGLTPSARTGLHADAPEEFDAVARWAAGEAV